ncbi:MAG: hypothetical protein ABF297_06045 [Thiogranum sp.]
MRNPCLTSSLLPLMLLAAGVLLAAPGVWAKPPICDRDKPNQYDPECVCPEQLREFAITGRLPTDLAEGSAVSVYPQGGAEYVVCMPPSASWNGNMVYASMGTVKLDPNEKEGTIVTVAGQLDNDGAPLSGLFNQAGYGFAVVAPPQLLSVPTREADLERLVELVEITLGEPTFSYVVGFSQGAIPATRLLERRGDDRLFSGGISACGPIGSFGSVPGQIQPSEPPLFFTQTEYSLQFLVIVDHLFPELKLLRDIPPPFVEVPRVPASTLATWDDDAVEAVFADSINAGKVVQLLEVMYELGLPVAVAPPNVPIEETLAELLEEVTFFVNDSVSDLGGSIFDNWATEYPDPELNAGVRRYSSTFYPADIDDALSPYETSGLRPGDPPLVALHNFLDHRVPYDHVVLYALKSDATAPIIKFPIPLGGIPRYGHCDFTAVEAALAFRCLIGVVEAELPPLLVCSQPPTTPGIP